jgi:hypothetical protein
MTDKRYVLRYIGCSPNPDHPDKPRREDMENLPPGKEFDIPPGGIIVGRGRAADVPVYCSAVKRDHLRVSPADDGAMVEDLKSTNGTALNEVWFSDHCSVTRVLARPGDRIVVAGMFEFEIVERPPI